MCRTLCLLALLSACDSPDDGPDYASGTQGVVTGAPCEATLDVSEACEKDCECVDGVCIALVCSECRTDADCEDGAACYPVSPTADQGAYNICLWP
jgi:hypothetical protein